VRIGRLNVVVALLTGYGQRASAVSLFSSLLLEESRVLVRRRHYSVANSRTLAMFPSSWPACYVTSRVALLPTALARKIIKSVMSVRRLFPLWTFILPFATLVSNHPSLIYPRLKTFLFCKSFPQWPSFSSSGLIPWIPRTVYQYF